MYVRDASEWRVCDVFDARRGWRTTKCEDDVCEGTTLIHATAEPGVSRPQEAIMHNVMRFAFSM